MGDLNKRQQSLMPQHGQRSFFGREGEKMIHQSIHHSKGQCIFLVEQHTNEQRSRAVVMSNLKRRTIRQTNKKENICTLQSLSKAALA